MLAAVIGFVAAAQPAAAQPGGLIWRPCPQDTTASCTTLELPIDRAAPGLGSFSLAIARRKATDPAQRIGVLMLNPGGPGASGVSMALGADKLLSPEVRARFDVIGFDPRGVGASSPIRCSSALLGNRPDEPQNQTEFEALRSRNQDLNADCRRHSGPIFDHADTLSVAQDMDALRAALGEEKVNFLGFSYGTQIGQQYTQLFGDRIRTMVLDGNMDHSLPLERFLSTAAAAGDDTLAAFARWCERTTTCALHGKNVLTHFDGLLNAADHHRLVEGAEGNAVSSWYLIQRVYGDLIRSQLPELAQWLSTLHPGPATPPTPATSHRATDDATTSANPRAAVFCQDWTPRVSSYAEWQRITRDDRAAAPHLRYSPEAREAALSCIGWPDKANNPPAPVKFPPGPAILLVNPRHDPATGYAWARSLHQQTADRTVLLRSNAIGHTAYPQSPCIRTAVTNYLLHQTVPGDLTCPTSTAR
ncbi:alpha/beta hydrolase [Amycolatopsis japonica]|uniref:alpha/beta hydrolase n=1 Tax=Amycolatopsis japonica TaxID=208439 RepID=UPI003328B57C